MVPAAELTIGEVAARAGVSVPTLRFYESRDLIFAERTTGNQRRYSRHVLRRLAFVAAAQRVGLSLDEVGRLLATLPADHAPTRADWSRLARPWRAMLEAKINQLRALQGSLDGCIGCGCLSLTRCRLFNPGDEASTEGPGSRWLRQASGG